MELTAKIRDEVEYVDVTVKEDESITRKKLDLSDFLMMLNESHEGAKYIPIGRVPYGYVTGAIAKGNTFWCTLALPAQKRNIIYYGEMHTIAFPAMLFHFKVQGGKLNESKCFALKEDTLTEKTKLYAYPFGNVYEDGKICWGTCSIPKCEKMADVERYLELFFSAGTNDDLYRGIVAKEYMNQRALLEFLKGEEQFPVEKLLPAGAEIKMFL